jgi:hypothetical protein
MGRVMCVYAILKSVSKSAIFCLCSAIASSAPRATSPKTSCEKHLSDWTILFKRQTCPLKSHSSPQATFDFHCIVVDCENNNLLMAVHRMSSKPRHAVNVPVLCGAGGSGEASFNASGLKCLMSFLSSPSSIWTLQLFLQI